MLLLSIGIFGFFHSLIGEKKRTPDKRNWVKETGFWLPTMATSNSFQWQRSAPSINVYTVEQMQRNYINAHSSELKKIAQKQIAVEISWKYTQSPH